MKRKQSKRRKYIRTGEGNLLKYLPICLWCGKPFCCARPDAKSCGPTCRRALNRYVERHGKPPMFPFGVPFKT